MCIDTFVQFSICITFLPFLAISMCSIKEFYSKYNNDLELLTLFLDEQKADLEALHLSQLTTSI